MQPDFFSPVCADLSLWCEGVKNFLGFADDVWSSWVEGVWVYAGRWCMRNECAI